MEQSRWKKYDAKISELIQEESSDVKIAQVILDIKDSAGANPDINGLRNYVSRFRKKTEPIKHTDNFKNDSTSTTTTTGYEKLPSMPSAWCQKLNRFYTIDEFCDVYGLEKEKVKSSKLITHQPGHMSYNIVFYEPEEETIIDIASGLEELVKKYIKPVMPSYDVRSDKEELLARLDIMTNHIKRFRKSSTLVIDELGDFLDGLGGETVRKNHKLPQNMNDKEVFDLGVAFKVKLVETLLTDYDIIQCNNVTEDNHSGVFGYFVNQAVKFILEAKYPERVSVRNMKRFIEHYTIGNHTFILSHGKDSESLKFGFKPFLDTNQAEKIDQYCKEHKLYNGNLIEFSKGDSHIGLYDDTTSNDFQYYNYPAFSPPSNWVKTNFKKSASGFKFYNIEKSTKTKIAIPYIF